MLDDDLGEARRWFAEELRFVARIEDQNVVDAFAAAPRERFVGPGPLRMLSQWNLKDYWTPRDSGPGAVYHDVLIAYDEQRRVNNGQPSLWAFVFDKLGVARGERVVHLGCGMGYYSAVLAELVGPTGKISGGYKPADPTGVPASLKDASVIDRGRYLIRAADCEACHTAIGGQPFAGGRAFVLPFGTIYSTNITPDKGTGIGQYADADFLAAVHRGVRRDGAPLYPAMPFASYTYLTDADTLAIKAYLFSLKPINAPAIPNTFAFPFDQRWAMGIWAMMFNANRRFEPHANQSAEWNRGPYLVEALAHCGECHTPRNLFQALDNRRKFAGAVNGGWRAFNITGDPTSGVGDWSEAALAHYLATGHAEGRGTAAGPMGEAVDLSLVHLTGEDIAAMVAYLRTVPPIGNPSLPSPRSPDAIAAHAPGGGAIH